MRNANTPNRRITLARNVYENSLTLHHFDVLAWVTVSQEFNATEILKRILEQILKQEKSHITDTVGVDLHKILSGRRYLVVLDDVWSVDVWEKIKFSFPDNCNRS